MKVTFKARIERVGAREVILIEEPSGQVPLSHALVYAIPSDVLVTIEFEPVYPSLESRASSLAHTDSPPGVY